MNFLAKVKDLVSPPFSTKITVGSMEAKDLNPSLSIVQCPSPHDPRLVDICVSVHPPTSDNTVRGPADICCVIDVSGSMMSPASVSETEDAGLSVLDVVKHAVNTITQSLSSYDRLSVVTFSDNAKVLFANLQMDAAGKAQAKRTVDALCTEGRTNLWAGLMKGMDILDAANKEENNTPLFSGQRNASLFLLTDGVPNVTPEGGHLTAMRRFREEQGGHYPGSIHTFGFGYSLQRDLLNEIAMEGNGTYNFIPDAGFVGTAFVNTLANQLSAYCTQTTVSLQLLDEEVTLVEASLKPNGSHLLTSWGVNINVGNLLFGQQRDFLVQVRVPEDYSVTTTTTPLVEVVLKYKPLFVSLTSLQSDTDGMQCVHQNMLDDTTHGALNLEVQQFRATLVRDLTDGYTISDTATSPELLLKTAMQTWHASMSATSDEMPPATVTLLAYVSSLLEDLSGQIRTAYSQQGHFNRWGTHYLPSLRCAHQRQQCNNFKDPGVQHYGGDLFRALRDAAEEVFLSLPPPKPSCLSMRNNGRYIAKSSTAVNMSTFHNAAAGCFEGSGRVTLADGTTKLVRDILCGDRVQCGGHSAASAAITTAKVECVIRTKCSLSNTAELVEMPNGGPLLTPWHPVWHEGAWQFPIEVTGNCSKVLPADYVYNFVLGNTENILTEGENDEGRGLRGQSVLVEGVPCITLAHGIEQNTVATHAFYGTEEVLVALQQYHAEGYKAGLVEMEEQHVLRSEESGLVCGFQVQN